MNAAAHLLASLSILLAIGGCSAMAHQEEAMRYMQEIENVLIEEGLCSDKQDCRRKEMAFWTAGGWKIGKFSGGGVSISVHNVSSVVIANKIVNRCKALHTQIPGVPVTVTVYSTASHPTISKVTVRERFSENQYAGEKNES